MSELSRNPSVPAVPETTHCPKCRGCKRVADTDEQEPWIDWLNLPFQNALAIQLGIVRPIPCPACGGTGLKA